MPKLKKSAPKSAKRARMKAEMDKWKAGTLRSGSKKGPRVKNRAQAIAIGLSESGQSKRGSRKAATMSAKAKAKGHVKAEKRMTKAAKRRPRNSGRS